MKKSHRKDVIIARIIFAVISVLLVLLIAGAVVLIKGRLEEKSTKDSQSESAQDHSQEEDTQAAEPIVLPEPTQEEEPDIIMQTTDDVRLRKEPNTDCDIITVIDKETKLEILRSEDGWAFVDYQGQTGYVSMDYLAEVTGAE